MTKLNLTRFVEEVRYLVITPSSSTSPASSRRSHAIALALPLPIALPLPPTLSLGPNPKPGSHPYQVAGSVAEARLKLTDLPAALQVRYLVITPSSSSGAASLLAHPTRLRSA